MDQLNYNTLILSMEVMALIYISKMEAFNSIKYILW